MPHKRKCKLKQLVEMEATYPDSVNTYSESLRTHYYHGRPDGLDELCLYDFVANYNFYSKNASGNRNYKKLIKSFLVNHRVIDPN